MAAGCAHRCRAQFGGRVERVRWRVLSALRVLHMRWVILDQYTCDIVIEYLKRLGFQLMIVKATYSTVRHAEQQTAIHFRS
jgi:hypothetical protein